jgi:hypothetical protein
VGPPSSSQTRAPQMLRRMYMHNPAGCADHCCAHTFRLILRLLRAFLLLLFVVALPWRGALAYASHCGGAGMPAEAAAVQASAAHALSDHGPHERGAAHDHAALADELPCESGAQAESGDACKHCSAFCSFTPAMGLLPAALAFLLLPGGSFPEFCAPEAQHFSQVQDRPPQSA